MSWIAGALVAGALVACAGAPTQRATATVAEGSRANGDAEPPQRPVPAPAPPGLILVGRARDYRQWVSLEQPSPLAERLKQKIAEDVSVLRDWDLTQPIEFAVVFDKRLRDTPEPPGLPAPERPASEAPARGSDAPSEQASEAVFEHLYGALSLPLARYAPETYEAHGFRRWMDQVYVRADCLVTSALGSAKARLICGDRPAAARALFTYLARGLPLEPLASAPIFFELRPQPLKEFWEPARTGLTDSLHKLAGLQGGTSARLAERLALDVLKEGDAWVRSAQAVRFEAGPNGDGELEATLAMVMRAPEPWLIESALLGASRSQGAPSAFLSLPRDVGAGWYSLGWNGLPAERTALLQAAVVNLAKTALDEFGPVSRIANGELTAPQAKVADRAVAELLATLDSPCARAETIVAAHVTGDAGAVHATAAGPAGRGKTRGPRPISFDAFARAAFGEYVLATPAAARCAQLVERWTDLLAAAQKLLPAKERQKVPLAPSIRKGVKLGNLPKATVVNLAVPSAVLEEVLKEASDATKDKQGKPGTERWARPKGPIRVSLILVPAADPTGSDWIGVGLDEKRLVQTLDRTLHPTAGETVGTRAELTPHLAARPLALSFQTFKSQISLLSLFNEKELGPALGAMGNLFEGSSLITTTQVQKRGDITEAGVSYYLSKQALAGVRQLLGMDPGLLETILKHLDEHLDSSNAGAAP